jgi:sirohydrochlorin cobaltochelatase
MERARLLGAHRIVVAPYFLFSGVLPDRVGRQAREYAAEHPDLDVRVAGLLGDCDELVDIVTERYHEAIAADIRMNCDTCLYRVALPGHEHRVGAPQTPHHHPDDPVHGHGHDGQHGHHTHTHDHQDPPVAQPAAPVAQPAPA